MGQDCSKHFPLPYLLWPYGSRALQASNHRIHICLGEGHLTQADPVQPPSVDGVATIQLGGTVTAPGTYQVTLPAGHKIERDQERLQPHMLEERLELGMSTTLPGGMVQSPETRLNAHSQT